MLNHCTSASKPKPSAADNRAAPRIAQKPSLVLRDRVAATIAVYRGEMIRNPRFDSKTQRTSAFATNTVAAAVDCQLRR